MMLNNKQVFIPKLNAQNGYMTRRGIYRDGCWWGSVIAAGRCGGCWSMGLVSCSPSTVISILLIISV